MHLTESARRALDHICDTFVPGDLGMRPAAARGVADAIVRLLDSNTRPDERERMARLLGWWNSPWMTALGGGGLATFAALSRTRREAVMRSWCDSRLVGRRAVFQALKKAALLLYYTLPEPAGGPNVVWDRMGYPGPLGPQPHPPRPAIVPVNVTRDVTLACDVCVVGSGAGGGTAAGVLASAGLDVVVLEAGGYYDDGDFDGAELAGLSRMYQDSGTTATADRGISLLAGSCLGGGTVVNYTTSFRTPDEVRREWAAHGVPAFESEQYTRSLDAVWKRLGVNQDHNALSPREQVVARGLAALGWHVDRMPRNVRGCDQGRACGYCAYGCQLGAKQSVVKTWLADACAAGARMLVDTRACRVIVRAGAAEGVEARTAAGHAVTVRARAVVVACGALHTPALLRRSSLGNANIGQHLRLHPVTAVCGLFDEETRPWEGTPQAIYSDQHRVLRDGYGVKYETTAVHPGLLAIFAPWRDGRQHHELMRQLRHLVPVGVLLRDRGEGEVRVERDGQPVAHYRLSSFDLAHVRAGLDGAASILEAAGAHTIFSTHARWVSYRPREGGQRERFLRDADAAGWGPGRCAFSSFHLMGSARMGGSPALSACNPDGETWDVRRLYVCDASAFPTASGVNPMISIEAIAHMNASGIASRLR